MNEITLSVDLTPALSALSGKMPLPDAEPRLSILPQSSAEALEAFRSAMSSLVTDNQSIQAQLDAIVARPLDVPSDVPVAPVTKPVVVPEAEPVITPGTVRQFAETIAPLVRENREVQVALEKIVPLPLEVPEGTVKAPVAEAATVREAVPLEAKPVVPPETKAVVLPETKSVVTPETVRKFAETIAPLVAENREVQTALEKIVPLPLEVPETKSVVTPETVRQFAETIAPLVAENREVQVALEKAVPLPLEVPVRTVKAPVAEAATVREAVPVEAKPVVPPETKAVVLPETKSVVTPETVRQFAETIAPLVAENREVQTVLEKIVPLPLEVPETKSVVTPETVRQFAETIAPLVAENREVQVALEKAVPLPLEVPVRTVKAPVAEAATVRDAVTLETKPVVTLEAKPVVSLEAKPVVTSEAKPVVTSEAKHVVAPEIVREFAEVIAPLVRENREVQVALEKAVPLPLEVPVRTVKAAVDETATDEDAVLQAVPVVQTAVADVARPEAVQPRVPGVAAVAAAPKVAPTPSEVLIVAAEAVADAIMVTPGLLSGDGRIHVQLKPDVLGGTEIQLNVTGRTIAVEFQPQTVEMGALIQRSLPQLEEHLAARIHSFTIAATVRDSRRRKV